MELFEYELEREQIISAFNTKETLYRNATKTRTKSTSCEKCDGNAEEEVESMKLLKKPKRSSMRVEAQKEV